LAIGWCGVPGKCSKSSPESSVGHDKASYVGSIEWTQKISDRAYTTGGTLEIHPILVVPVPRRVGVFLGRIPKEKKTSSSGRRFGT